MMIMMMIKVFKNVFFSSPSVNFINNNNLFRLKRPEKKKKDNPTLKRVCKQYVFCCPSVNDGYWLYINIFKFVTSLNFLFVKNYN